MLSSQQPSLSTRLRQFMPLMDEIERMEDEIWSDSWFIGNRNLDTSKSLKSGREDQKMLEEGKASDNRLATRALGSDDWLSSLWTGFNVNNEISLKVDEQNDKLLVNARLPNFQKDQMKLQVKDGLLTLSGEVLNEKKDENSYSKSSKFVSRSIRLPDNINQEGISARYDDGMLKVIVPKSDQTKPKKGDIMIE